MDPISQGIEFVVYVVAVVVTFILITSSYFEAQWGKWKERRRSAKFERWYREAGDALPRLRKLGRRRPVLQWFVRKAQAIAEATISFWAPMKKESKKEEPERWL